MMDLTEWFILGFWALAGLAIILAIAISAEEWISEKFHGNGER